MTKDKVLTMTAALDVSKCCLCRRVIKAGSKMVVTRGESYVDFRHFECPEAPMNDWANRTIQGSDK